VESRQRSKFKICKKSGAIMDIFSSFFKKIVKLIKQCTGEKTQSLDLKINGKTEAMFSCSKTFKLSHKRRITNERYKQCRV